MTANEYLPSVPSSRLRERAAIARQVREFFDRRGFLEVDTPALSADVVVDRHLDPLAVTLFDDPRQPTHGPTFWLQTSPEFHMKRLLAAGEQAIFQFARAFRGGEVGPLHNPEFTMLEWYRVGDDYVGGRKLLGEFATELLRRGEPDQISFREAFERTVRVDPHTATVDELKSALREHGLATKDDGASATRDVLLDLALVKCVEPNLGRVRPAIVYDYPATQSALARVRTDLNGPAVAERFELYVDGIELANGYHELLDAEVLLARNRTNNKARRADGKAVLPCESRLLAAMRAGLPACAGTAVGFDRLVMVATGAKSIREVMAFPIDRA